MKVLLTIAGVLLLAAGLLVISQPAEAQRQSDPNYSGCKDGPCARESRSVAACVACVDRRVPGKWTLSQRREWCGRWQPQCSKR
jgi:hypothetical protein